jgi:hypothetical protein
MDRYVHHELRGSLTALLAFVGSAVPAGAIHGFPPVRIAWWWPVGGLAYLALSVLVQGSRLKGFSRVRDFEAAIPLDAGRPLPPEPFRRDSPVSFTLLPVILVPTLALALFVSSWFALMPVALALEWLGQAAVCARWERRNGRRIWRGHVGSRPWELSYSLVSPAPPTRTATGAPPG